MQEVDLVYFVKDSKTNEELRYSLRSVCKNLNFRKVVFYGTAPDGIEPDVLVKVTQEGRTKWDKVKNMLIQACRNSNITDNFVLMNDDFFVLSPTMAIPTYQGVSLYELIVTIEMKYGNQPTAYTKQLRRTLATLKAQGYPVMSYELHVPIVINKQRMLDTIDRFSDFHATRTLYGNINRIGGEPHDDVKVTTLGSFAINGPFVSTSDDSFRYGEIGTYIRKQFAEPCKYEKGQNETTK